MIRRINIDHLVKSINAEFKANMNPKLVLMECFSVFVTVILKAQAWRALA